MNDPKLPTIETPEEESTSWVARSFLKIGKAFNGASRWFVTFLPPISFFTDPLAFSLDLIGGAAQTIALWVDPNLEKESQKEKQATSGLRAVAGVVGFIGALGVLGVGAVAAAPILVVAAAVGVFVSNFISYFRSKREYKEILAQEPKPPVNPYYNSPKEKAVDEIKQNQLHTIWKLKCDAKEAQLTTNKLGFACSGAALMCAVLLVAGLPFTFPIAIAGIFGAIVGVGAGWLGRRSALKEKEAKEFIKIEEYHMNRGPRVVVTEDPVIEEYRRNQEPRTAITEIPEALAKELEATKQAYIAEEKEWPPSEYDPILPEDELSKKAEKNRSVETKNQDKDKKKNEEEEEDEEGEGDGGPKPPKSD